MVTAVAEQKEIHPPKKALRGIYWEIEQIEMDTKSTKDLAQIGEMAQNCGLDLDYSAQFNAIFDRVNKISKSIENIKQNTDLLDATLG